MPWTKHATIIGPPGIAGPPGAQGPPGPGTTPEEVQDVVGAMATDSATIDFTYDDTAGTLTALVKDASVTEAKLSLSDVPTANASGTAHGLLPKLSGSATTYLNGAGAWTTPAGSAYTDEQAQDAIGAMLVDTATIDLTYTDATPSLTAAVVAGSIGTTQLTNGNVTYAKIQNVTDARLLGRSAGSAGTVQEITVGSGLSLSGGALTATAGGAPAGAQYLVGATDATLTAERVVTNTTSITWDLATAGQAKAQVPSGGITYAMLQNVSATDRLLGRATAGAGVVEEIVCTAQARTLLDDTTQAAMQTTLGLVPGTHVQPLDATLTALAGLATGANQLAYSTGTDTFAQTPLTAAGRALLDDVDAAAQRTTLGLGTAAQQAYTEATAVLTATGFSGTAPTITAVITQVGKLVTVELPALTGTSNATTCTLTGLPAGYSVPRPQWLPVLVRDDNLLRMGLLHATGTTLTLYPNATQNGWTASGVKAFEGGVLVYRIP